MKDKARFALTSDGRSWPKSRVPPFGKGGRGGISPRLARTEAGSNPPRSPFNKGEDNPAVTDNSATSILNAN
jgi:hypothetical protein